MSKIIVEFVKETFEEVFQGEFKPTQFPKLIEEVSRNENVMYGDGEGNRVMQKNFFSQMYKGLSDKQRTDMKVKMVKDPNGKSTVVVEDTTLLAKLTYQRDTKGKPAFSLK